MSTAKRQFSRSEKRWFTVAGCVVALIFLGGYWWRWLNADPVLNIPTPKLPSPNAFDYYVKAGQAIVAAVPAVDPVNDPKPPPTSPQALARRYPTAAKEAWLVTNAPALQLLRQGFTYRYQHPPVRSFSASLPYGHLGELARLLTVESHARAERGNWAGASDSALDILRLFGDFPRGGPVIAGLMGNGMQAMGRRELWNIVPHLDAPTSRKAAQRLEKIVGQRVPFAATLQEEKWSTQAHLLELLRDPQWRSWSFRSAKSLPDKARAWFTPKRAILNSYSRAMDIVIANAHRPYPAPRQPIPPADNPLTADVWPDFKGTRHACTRNETGNALLLVALALRAFRLEHGAYPTNLSNLVPGYIKQIPADPFGGGQSLHYRRTGSTYLLWSIGPDGVDNKGQPIDSMVSGKKESTRRFVLPDSKGDMVAGINR